MRVTVEPGGESETEARKLFELVWPPNRAPSPVAHISWTNTFDLRVLTRDASDLLINHVGLIFRDAVWNGKPVRLGGVGSVGTHPLFRGQGHASRALKQAAETLATHGLDFAALFCAPTNIAFYERLNWREFHGDVFIMQPKEGRIPFGYCMTLALKSAPQSGVLDICGLPW